MWLLVYEVYQLEENILLKLYRLNTETGRVIPDIEIIKSSSVAIESYLIRRSADIGIPLLTDHSKILRG